MSTVVSLSLTNDIPGPLSHDRYIRVRLPAIPLSLKGRSISVAGGRRSLYPTTYYPQSPAM